MKYTHTHIHKEVSHTSRSPSFSPKVRPCNSMLKEKQITKLKVNEDSILTEML